MTPSPTPEGPGSVSGAPNLPAGFADMFRSRYVDIGGLSLHAVVAARARRYSWFTDGPRPGTRGAC